MAWTAAGCCGDEGAVVAEGFFVFFGGSLFVSGDCVVLDYGDCASAESASCHARPEDAGDAPCGLCEKVELWAGDLKVVAE